MRSRPYIFLVDPWKRVTDIDSGWGNRLQCWEAASIIASRIGSTHTIKVPPEDYPELSQVSLPNTGYTDSQGVNTVPITNEDVDRWVQNKKIDLNNNLNYSIEYDFVHTHKISSNFYDINNDKLTNIKLLSSEINSALNKFSENKIGIHIRRGSGVYVTTRDIKSIPKEYRKFYSEATNNDRLYTFYRDSEYFKFIDKTIENHNEVKFYIGLDVDEKAIEYYKTKYSDRIYTASDVIDKIKPILDKASFLEPRLHLKKMGNILLDFFILSKCSRIIVSPYSSWSYMACRIAGKYGTEINNLDHIDELSAKEPLQSHLRSSDPLIKKVI